MQEPLVLLPGMMCDARLYYAQVAAFSQNRSVTVAPINGGDRIEEIASDLLMALPPRFALAGTGLGASVALELLRRGPDRVTRIALTDAHPMAGSPQISADQEPMIVKAKAGRLKEALHSWLQGYEIADQTLKLDIWDLLLDMAEAQGGEAFVRQVRTMQRRRDQQATLRKCRVPAMVICGADCRDHRRKHHAFIAELLHSASLREIEGAADMPMLENPRAYTQALRDWLAQPLVLR